MDFVSYYVEIPLMFVIAAGWTLYWRPWKTNGRSWYKFDIRDTKSLDLKSQQYEESEEDHQEDERRNARQKGKKGILWRVYYLVA